MSFSSADVRGEGTRDTRLSMSAGEAKLAGVRGCRRKRQLSFFAIGSWLFIYLCSEDLNKQFSPSRSRFFRRTPTSQDRLLFVSSSGQIIPRINLLTRRRK